jgi:uncharacterized membrane protein
LFNVVGNVLVFWAAIVGVASVVVHSRVRWWETRVGQHLFYYMLTMATVLVLACIRVVFGDSWWFQLLRLIVFIGIPVLMTQRLIIQVSVQRAAVKAGMSQAVEDSARHRAESAGDGDGRP